MSNTCAISGTKEAVNTSMAIKLDTGHEITIWLCDDAAENMTLKQIREKISEKIKAGSQLLGVPIEQVIELYTKGNSQQPVQSVQSAQQPVQQIQQIQQIQQAKPNQETSQQNKRPNNELIIDSNIKYVDGRTADSRRSNVIVKIDKSQNSGDVGPQYPGYEVRSSTEGSIDIKSDEKVLEATVSGPGGVPVKIPVHRKSKIGTTMVIIDKVDSDVFNSKMRKKMAESLNQHVQSTDFRNGYGCQFKSCLVCNSTGVSMGKICKKCNGTGEIMYA